MRIEEVKPLGQTAATSERHRPKIIKWKGVSMVRNHSFLATIDEIVEFSKEIDVVKVGIVGDQHSGKSTEARAIGHAVHKKAEQKYGIKFAIRIFKEDDLLNFKETLKGLSPANYVIIFDDVSFLESDKRMLNTVKNAVTKIRHMEDKTDIKVILIYNYHYTLGFDKYLRQADFYYFLTVGTSDLDNVAKLTKGRSMQLINNFVQLRRKAIVKKHWSVQLTPKEFFSYKWRNPFIPVIFYNNESARLIVSPTRQFMDKVCSTCATADGMKIAEIPFNELVLEGNSKFGPEVLKAAFKLKLFENGLTVYAKSIMAAKRWIDRALEKKIITYEQVMLYYNFTQTKTRLRKQFSSLITDEATNQDNKQNTDKFAEIAIAAEQTQTSLDQPYSQPKDNIVPNEELLD